MFLHFKCNAIWKELEDTSDRLIKFCQGYQKEVHCCSDDDKLASAVRLKSCVDIEKDPGFRLLGDIRDTKG